MVRHHKKRHHKRKHKKMWIQEAIKHKGALREYLMRNKNRLERHLHMKIFKENGTISIKALRKLKRLLEEGKIKSKEKTKLLRRINLAITLHKLRNR